MVFALVSVPLRGDIFQIRRTICFWNSRKLVSVPLRGDIFQIFNRYISSSNRDIVSVPLRGDIFQILKLVYSSSRQSLVSVPLRGDIFQIVSLPPRLWRGKRAVSVPLRRDIFQITCKKNISIPATSGFRPLTGRYISNYLPVVYIGRNLRCFRPLTGRYISNKKMIMVFLLKLETVSVPLRGDIFQILSFKSHSTVSSFSLYAAHLRNMLWFVPILR